MTLLFLYVGAPFVAVWAMVEIADLFPSQET